MPKRKSVDDESDAIAHPQPQPPRRSLRHKPASEQHESESVPPKKENKNKAPRKPKAGEYGTQEAPSGADRTQDHSPSSGKQYWLMKAEPESRLEKGVDVKFSIDDLAAKTEPEPWDGTD